MSTYKHKWEFIERTQNILNIFEKSANYEKTLFLNCCIGLLVVPQQWKDENEESMFIINESVTYDKWGIAPDNLKGITNNPKKGTGAESIENIAYHFRNSLCHNHFDIMGQDTEKITQITIVDYFQNLEQESFRLTLQFSDFKKFIMTYATEKNKIIKANS